MSQQYAPKQGIYKDWVKSCYCTYLSFKEWTTVMQCNPVTNADIFRWRYNVFFTYLGDGII